MKILLFCGGSGSERLQKGLWQLFGDSVELSIIINGYDDGKSTGIVRDCFHNAILGPSDLRKNHLLQHKLRYGESALYSFLNKRSTGSFGNIMNELFHIRNMLTEHKFKFIKKCVHGFFEYTKYNKCTNDFNFGNIVYAYCFFFHGTDDAKLLLCDLLDIPDCVHFQCNKPYKLKAITEQGYVLSSEEEISTFNDENNKIKKVALFDKNDTYIEFVTIESNIFQIVDTSDVIIVSCGTMWSSLIPTFLSSKLYTIIKKSSATKYLIPNLQPDMDTLSYSFSEYISCFNEYLPMHQFTIVLPDIPLNWSVMELSNVMPKLNKNPLFVQDSVDIDRKYHNGYNVMLSIFYDNFKEFDRYNHFIFDYDYTLYDSTKPLLSTKLITILEKIKLYKRFSILSRNDCLNVCRFKHITCNGEMITNHGQFILKSHIYLNKNIFLTKQEKYYIKYFILKKLKLTDIQIEDRNTAICIRFKNKNLRDSFFMKRHIFTSYYVVQSGNMCVEIMKQKLTKKNGYDFLKKNIQMIASFISFTLLT